MQTDVLYSATVKIFSHIMTEERENAAAAKEEYALAVDSALDVLGQPAKYITLSYLSKVYGISSLTCPDCYPPVERLERAMNGIFAGDDGIRLLFLIAERTMESGTTL